MGLASRIISSSVLLGSFLLGVQTQAATLGELQLAGEGCQRATGKVRLIVPSQSLYSIPLNLRVFKSETVTLERKACTMLLPVILGTNEKLVLEDANQKINLRLNPRTTATAQLEVFLAGGQGEVIKDAAQAVDSSLKDTLRLRQSGQISETECGAQVIVRANESIAIIGSGSASAISDNLRLKLKVVKCD